MTDIVNNATIRVVADASGVEAGLRPAIDAAQRAGQAITQSGASAAGAARSVESAQRNIIASIQRTTMAMESGGRTTAAYYEAQARQRNVDPASLTPYLNQLRAVEAAQNQATESTRAQAVAARELAQAQANKESFLAGLREQIALFGKSTEEVLRYRAAQAGASQEAAQLILQLQNMRAAQEQVEAAARAAALAQREAAQADASRNAFLQGLREQIALFGLSTDEVHRYRAAQVGASSAADPLIAKLRDLRLAQEQATYGERMLAQAQREAAQARAGQDSFLKGLENQAQAIGKTRIELLELQAAQMGVTTRAKPFIDQLRAADTALQGGGMSAAAMNAALRNVPAQMTDIIVSLQGGQAPLTVLLQQGGQLRDMFGSIGGAARALGGAVLGLINPYTVTAALVATGALAFKSGYDESLKYSRALIMTGNIAGTTAGQMSDMANSMELVNGSQAASAKALTALASTGAIAGTNLEKFGTVAVDAQRILGKSVEDTAKEFAALGKDPLTALRAMGDQYGFVTTETYRAVKAAQEQGRMIDAASIAQNAYANGVASQKDKVLATLSAWERGWINLKKLPGEAWDAVVEFAGGRVEGPQQQMAALDAQSKAMESRIERLKRIGKNRDGEAYDPSKDRDVLSEQALLAANQRTIQGIQQKAKAEEKAAQDKSIANQREMLQRDWDDKAKILRSRQEQRDMAMDAAKTQGKALGVPEEEIQKRLSAIRREYNDVYVAGIDNSLAALRKRGEVEDALSKRALDRIQAQRDAGSISEEDALRQTATQQLADMDRVEAGLRRQLALTSSKIGSQQQQTDIEGQITKLGIERGSRSMQLERELAALQRDRAQASNDLYMQGVTAANAELSGIAAQVEAQRLANEEIGLSTEGVAVLRAERMLALAALKEQTAAELEASEKGSVTAEVYRRQAAELRNLAVAKQQGAVNEGIAEANKKAQDSLKEFLDPARAQTFGEALREAFGTAGDSITKVTSALDAFGKRQAKIAEERGNADMLLRNGKISEIEHLEYVDQLNQENAKNRMAGYGAMTSAAAGFFGEQSRGYEAMMGVSKVFHAAELAMTLAELVPKGISAVLSQGEGDPYSAFGRMAAMAAIVTGLGVAIGSLSGGGGVPLSESRQKKQGTGSVLGSDDKSESIARALDGIEGATVQDLAISNGMLASLRNIEVGIGQFSSLLVRTTGVTGKFGADMGKNVFDTKAIGLGGAVLGGVGGVMGGAYLGMGASQIGLMLGGPVGMALGAALGAVIGKTFIGKALGSVFGGKQTVEDTGFTLAKTSLAGIRAGSTDASQYAEIKKAGGWFGSDKTSVKTEGLGADGNRQIASILTSLYDTVFEAGKMLGIGADGFEAQLNSFVVDIGKVSLKGLSDDEIEKELSAVFSKVGDNLASFGVAGLESFQKVGEGYLETLTRVATNYQAVSVVTSSMGMTFSAVGLASVGARERLIDLAGGLDEFTSSADQFLADFYTDKERAAALRTRITPTLDQFGIKTGAEDSLKQFRSVVTGLDLTTEAGARAYATLMQIAPAFKQIVDVDADVLEKATDLANSKRELEIQIMELLGDKAGALAATRVLELSKMDASLRPLRERVYALEDEASALATANSLLSIQAQIYELTGDKAGAAAVLSLQHVNALAELDPALRGATKNLWDLQAAAKAAEQVKTAAAALLTGVDGAYSALQSVVERQKKALKEDIDIRTKAVEKTKSLSEALRSTLDGLAVAGAEKNDRAAAQAQIQAALATAKATGILPKADDLKNALSVIGKDSTGLFGSQEDYLRDFYATKNGITDLATITDKSLSAEERSLKALEGQVKQYDQMLEREQEQIDVLKGISTIGLSIEQAVRALSGAMGAAGANPYNSATSQISDAYKSSLGRAPDAAGLSYWQDKAAAGVSTESIIGSIKASPEAQLQALYKDLFDRPADADGLNFWLQQIKAGTSLDAVKEAIKGGDEAKKLRGFAVGTNRVPYDMPALIHEDERIIPAADNRELMRRLASPGENSAVLVAAVERLTAENQGMRKDLNDALYAIAKNTMNTASSLDDALNGDKPLATKIIKEEVKEEVTQ
jgi:hypothetical protein